MDQILKIAAVDDDEEMLRKIRKNIIQAFKRVNIVVTTYNQPRWLIYDMQESVIHDIYFIDIIMPDINGIELAQKVREKSKEAYIVFLTAYPNYALRSYAYTIKAYQYILKNEMERTLVSVLQEILLDINILQEKYYIIKNRIRLEKVKISDITYIYKEGKNAIFVTSNGNYKDRKSLGKVFSELSSNDLMFVERGAIVNLAHVKTVIKHDVIMDNNVVIPISRVNVSKVKQAIAEYWNRKI